MVLGPICWRVGKCGEYGSKGNVPVNKHDGDEYFDGVSALFVKHFQCDVQSAFVLKLQRLGDMEVKMMV